ncbi:MAG TPA: hypothetical protein VGH32_11070 [Pirellulales bacterium]|jgi:hypothetical protein
MTSAGCSKSVGLIFLVIDELKGTAKLPQTFGRNEPHSLATDQLLSLVVADVEQRDSEGSISHSHNPTLIWRDGEGAEHREKLAEWTDSARAQEFADWLRGRLKFKATNLESLAEIGKRFVNG